MSKKISIDQLCLHYEVEADFIYALNDHGLLSLVKSKKGYEIYFEHLGDFERFVHLHYELEINMEGLEAITHLLDRVKLLQQEIKQLKKGAHEA
ncbi:chaperone modulator CbpM [Pedobacter sp. KR3-3]|uniref:Chaperone modulator CbpM n=1 Tax=Pedobacter albus TaxID=3113905 RepID=A0ABU7I5J1_9SPHI|nr:chaperone modulator CbpM [Pedobacter sp. KR3-3]MEE1944727.1 chaperone modulator CbpM [Pedobacter sp. KR3-3]